MVFVPVYTERCFKIHRIMLITMGLWPYQKSFIWRIQTVFVFGLYFSSLCSQLLTFAIPCNMDCTLKRISYISLSLVYFFTYCSFLFNFELIKQTVEHIQVDWKTFEKSVAKKTFEEYLFESYVLIISVLCFLIACGLILLIYECMPIILDVLKPLNVSRPRKIEVELELFISQEQYFFLYLLQEVLGLLVGVWSIMSTGLFMTTIEKHCCAAYKIASYLIQNTVTAHTLQFPDSHRMQFMYRSICLSVHIHRRTFEFCKRSFDKLNVWFFPIIVFGVLAISCLLFRMYYALMRLDDLHDMFVTCVVLYVCSLYMFLINIFAQSYTEHSIEIVESIYNTLWYLAPFSIQKLFLLMQKSIKSHKLSVGGLFVASIEGLSTLLSSIISYFTMMHSMRP